MVAFKYLLPHAKSGHYKGGWVRWLACTRAMARMHAAVGQGCCSTRALRSPPASLTPPCPAAGSSRHATWPGPAGAVKALLKVALSGMAAQEVKDLETCVAGAWRPWGGGQAGRRVKAAVWER